MYSSITAFWSNLIKNFSNQHMKTYLCIFTALIVFSLAQLNFSSHHQSDNPTDEVSFSSVLDLGEDGNIDNMTSSIADVKNRSEISSDEMDMYSPQTFFTTPQNMTFKTFSKDFLRRNSTLKVSMLPGDLSNSTIYHCGYKDVRDIYEHIYPEYKEELETLFL